VGADQPFEIGMELHQPIAVFPDARGYSEHLHADLDKLLGVDVIALYEEPLEEEEALEVL